MLRRSLRSRPHSQNYEQNVPQPPRLRVQIVTFVNLEPKDTPAMVSFPSFVRFKTPLRSWACRNWCSNFYVTKWRTHARYIANTERKVWKERQNKRARLLSMHRVLSGVNLCTTCHVSPVLLHDSRPILLYRTGWECYHCSYRGIGVHLRCPGLFAMSSRALCTSSGYRSIQKPFTAARQNKLVSAISVLT